MRAAVVGGGISGVVAARVLAKAGVHVVLYDDEDSFCNVATTFDGVELNLVDFMFFNKVVNPDKIEFFEDLGLDIDKFDMSFSVSQENGKGYEWGTHNGFSSLFSQKSNLINPNFWQMHRQLLNFKNDVLRYLEELENNPDIDRTETLEEFVGSHNYSELFLKAYLLPICGSLWPSCSTLTLSAFSVFSFLKYHHLLQIFGHSELLTVKQGLRCFINKIKEDLKSTGCHIRARNELDCILIDNHDHDGCSIICQDGSREMFDGCIFAVHAPEALRLLGKQVTSDEIRILGAFPYIHSAIYLHRDKNLMPQNPTAWSACNFIEASGGKTCLTYNLNIIQNINETSLPFLITLNPVHTPELTLLKWETSYPTPSIAASKASMELDLIQGKRRIWFCGNYQGYGFRKDGLESGMVAAHKMLGKHFDRPRKSIHRVSSLMDTGARLFLIRFLKDFIDTGCLILLEEDGTTFTFQGTKDYCSLKSILRVHNPLFYWKVVTQSDVGLANAFMDGDFSFANNDEGLLNLILIIIFNKQLNSSASKISKKRGWWTPMLFTSIFSSAKYFLSHVLRKNALSQAQRNISEHYDLSNELFAIFMDETMQYSNAIFKTKDEDLKTAQMRKMSMLIEKARPRVLMSTLARIDENHEVLEIGCGWGIFAIEVVKQTGCKYTGISLSEEQLKYAEMKVIEAGLQEHIKFLLCDYRQLPKFHKYDKIIACEMIEHVGHEYMDEFFGCCETLLAENGLLILQFSWMPDESYDEYIRSSGFMKEYIFPGTCLPSLSRVTLAMAANSRLKASGKYRNTLCSNIAMLEKKFPRKQEALGFDEKFMRKWQYYFDYCAAGFKARTLGNYQMVFSRSGNMKTFGEPY
ncbi:hypothetical protein ACFE04_029793 [Oxalis oulophora]